MVVALSPHYARIYMLDEKIGPWVATDLITDVLLRKCLVHSLLVWIR